MALLIFNKWSTEGIKVDDPGLQRYITLEPRVVPKTGARYAGKRFHKSKTFLVERLVNKVMVPGHKADKHYRSSGHCTGKAPNALGIVKKAFEMVEKQTKENPVKVFTKAVENAAPREEILTIEYGGARYPKSVECSPQRRIDQALKFMVQGAYAKSFNTKKSISDAVAEEITAAYRLDQKSLAISKKLEVERQADSSR
ncbi:30S ribosomal protein S7 [Candidatus Woesearchaeota archaeon]|nr:30S ribosomal protein S7 [Candidatus Woesearchaeota archaeon]